MFKKLFLSIIVIMMSSIAVKAKIMNLQVSASQIGNILQIFVSGETPTSGYKIDLNSIGYDKDVPVFEIKTQKPSGPAAQMISPFQLSTEIEVKERILEIILLDKEKKYYAEVQYQDK